MAIRKIALIGAAGNLGSNILKALLDDGHEVTILSRQNSTSTDTIPEHPRQIIKKLDLEDVNSLALAFDGIEGVVSNVAGGAVRSQKTLIDAAVIAGVKRFLPSDFGMDLNIETNKTVPFYQPKIEIAHYLKEKAEAHPDFSYTIVSNGLFLEWGLNTSVLADLRFHSATLWDGGETKVSTTTLASVAKAVAGVFRDLEATKNKQIRVHDTTITQKQIIEMAKEIDGKAWTTMPGSTAEAYQAALDELKKPKPDIRFAIFNQLYRTLFSADHMSCFEDRLDNDVVGLPLMTYEQVKEVVKRCMQ